MATIDDVEQGLCIALASVMFPGQQYLAGQVGTCIGPWIGSTGAPTLSPQVRLGIGEPTSGEMQRDIAAAVSNLAVTRISGSIRDCTFARPRWIQTSCNMPNLLATLAEGTVTFGGMAGSGVVAGVTAANVCYAYRCGSNDTPFTVAERFASLIPGAAAVDTILTAPAITGVNVVADQQTFWCTGQQEALVQVVIVATPSTPGGSDGPLVRAVLTRLVHGLQAMMRPDGSLTRFIGLPDGTQAGIFPSDERDDDSPGRDDVWKRIVTFRMVYDIGVAQAQHSMLAPLLIANTNAVRLLWIGTGAPVTGVLTDGQGNMLGDAGGDLLGVL